MMYHLFNMLLDSVSCIEWIQICFFHAWETYARSGSRSVSFIRSNFNLTVILHNSF